MFQQVAERSIKKLQLQGVALEWTGIYLDLGLMLASRVIDFFVAVCLLQSVIELGGIGLLGNSLGPPFNYCQQERLI